MIVVLGLFTIASVVGAQSGEANLDNDSNENDIESFSEDTSLDPGKIVTEDEDNDGDFDSIVVGVRGGGAYYAQAQMDGDESEEELVFSDPTLESGEILTADADSDGDAEVIWVGIQGADFDGDEELEIEESGSIIAVLDIDSDGNVEVIVADSSRAIGEFEAGSFGLKSGDDIEVLWIGVLTESLVSRGATFLDIVDSDSDGEKEVRLKDIRIERPMPSFGAITLDVDGDGDDDVIIEE